MGGSYWLNTAYPGFAVGDDPCAPVVTGASFAFGAVGARGFERRLQETDRRVALGEEQILRQRAIIVDLETRGDDANLAKEQLQTPEEAQGLRLADRERLSKELVSLQAAGG
jgi:hypothetical protein